MFVNKTNFITCLAILYRNCDNLKTASKIITTLIENQNIFKAEILFGASTPTTTTTMATTTTAAPTTKANEIFVPHNFQTYIDAEYSINMNMLFEQIWDEQSPILKRLNTLQNSYDYHQGTIFHQKFEKNGHKMQKNS